MRIVKPVAAVAAGALLLGSCNGDPFSLNLQKVDEKSDPAPASIKLTEAQIYPRENLINDRHVEETYLKKLLDDSEKIPFTPAIKRDLNAFTSLMLSLSASFNPTAGAQARRGEDVADMKLELDKAGAALQLAKLQKQLEDFKNNVSTADTTGLTKDGKQVFQTETPTTAQVPASVADLTAKVKLVQDQLAALAAQIEKLASVKTADGSIRDANLEATPEEDFDARQAYRSQLRSELESSRLDGSHDLNGNALFRLQMKASVFPGKVKNRYGVAYVTIDPPQLESSEINKLYYDWLSSVTADLNAASADHRMPPQEYYALASGTGLFDIVEVPFGGDKCKAARRAGARPKDEDKCAIVSLALPSSLASFVKTYLDKGDEWAPRFNAVQKFYDDIRPDRVKQEQVKVFFKFKPFPPKEDVKKDDAKKDDAEKDDAKEANKKPVKPTCLGYVGEGGEKSSATLADLLTTQSIKITNPDGTERTDSISLETFFHETGRVVAVAKMIGLAEFRSPNGGAGSIAGLGSIPADNQAAQRDFVETVRKFQQWSQASTDLDDLIVMANPDCELAERKPYSPDAFFEAITGEGVKTGTFVYSSAPAELAQRVSTVTSATEALQLIGALNAAIPTSGLGIDAAANYMHSATGRVDALESLPIVLGFSDANDFTDSKSNSTPDADAIPSQVLHFGWLFGPKAVVNPENHTMELRQVPMHEAVTADISIPGWWPSVTVTKRAAWVRNFHDGEVSTDAEAVGKPEKYVKTLSNPQRLDNLTDFLSSVVWGQQFHRVNINAVEPSSVSVCAGTTSFIIRGPNLWRNGEVYLNGRRAKEPIHVLPDMLGIVADIDLDGLVVNGTNEQATIQVFTQVGSAEREITLNNSNCGPLGSNAAAAAKPVLPVVWPEGGTFTLTSSAAWPSSDLTVKLFPLGQEGNASRTVTIAPGAVTASDKTLVAKIVDKIAWTTQGEGTRMEGIVQTPVGQETHTIAKFGPLYLYSGAPAAALSVAGVFPATIKKDKLSTVGITIKAKFPEKFDAAYESWKTRGISVKISAPSGKTVLVRDLTIPASDSADRVTQTDLIPTAAEMKIIGDGDVSLTVSIVPSDDANGAAYPNTTTATFVAN